MVRRTASSRMPLTIRSMRTFNCFIWMPQPWMWWFRLLDSMVAQLNQSAGDKAQKDRFYAAVDRVKERAYASLDQMFRQRIAEFGPSEDIERYRNDWFQAIHRDLIGIAGEYRDQSPAPSFLPKANGARSSEQIFDRFLSQLNKYLGPLPSREGEAASEKEVR